MAKKWVKFPHADKAYAHDAAGLKKLWARLHKGVYAIAVLAVLHFWWLVKSDVREPALYAAIAAVLLGWRAWKAWRGRQPTPAKVRTSPSAPA